MNVTVYTCTDFRGHWPVGTAAVVVAQDETEARALLDSALAAQGLGGDYTLTPLPLSPGVCILADGDY